VCIVRSILCDEHTVMTISSLVPASMGLGEVCLSLPTILGGSGISWIVTPPHPTHEQAPLNAVGDLTHLPPLVRN
jgi:L-lactate dehydrogenase